MNFISYYIWGTDYELQQRQLESKRRAKQEQLLKVYSLFLWIVLFAAVLWVKYQVTLFLGYLTQYITHITQFVGNHVSGSAN